MSEYIYTPKVDETQEFIEIANDFSNPLDLVREAISNSYDANATEIEISFSVNKEYGENVLVITISDNGDGMTKNELENFFDLGNSSRRNNEKAIGEKGHGTKVYFNSRHIQVRSFSKPDGLLIADMVEPFRTLYDRKIPKVNVQIKPEMGQGTQITIRGYNNNRRDKFTHSILKDYIMWFTKHGAIDKHFITDRNNTVLRLKGIDKDKFECIAAGHFFPEESKDINKLFEHYLVQAPNFYSKQIVKQGSLKNFPEIKFQAIFSIEGKNVKYSYNEMIRRPGYSAPEGSYTISERYGLWICKDYIPIQKKNEWITYKGSEYTKFHAFINCQGLRLTANRSSVDNTPSEIINDLKEEVRKLYDSIINSEDWTSMEWLEEEASAYQTTEKEKNSFKWRIDKINRANIAKHEELTLVEPERESGVFSIFLMLNQKHSSLFPFQIIDYDTHEGIDVIAKSDSITPISNSKLYFVEFKRTLAKSFNHSFENLYSVICWETSIKHDEIIKDVNNEERKMQIIAPDNNGDYTRFFLDNPKKAHKIEVYCLKTYLKEKLKIEFNPRTSDAVI